MRKTRCAVKTQRVADVAFGVAGTCAGDGRTPAPALGPALGAVCAPSGGAAPLEDPDPLENARKDDTALSAVAEIRVDPPPVVGGESGAVPGAVA